VFTARLHGVLGLVAYVFRGDADDPDRVWICVRSQESPVSRWSPRSWLGCWSSREPTSREGVKGALMSISAKIDGAAKRGPHGPHLGGYHSIPDWDSWGIGNPKPIADIPLGGDELGSLPEVDVEDFTFEP
jgi:hypothetical protein